MLKPAVALATAAALLAGMAGSANATDVLPASSVATNGAVNVIVRDAGGRAYVGGDFDHAGPRLGSGVVFTGSSEAPSPALPDIDGAVYSAVFDGAGGVFIGGAFSAVGGVPRSSLAHILADGTLDPDWNPGANGGVYEMALSPSGESLYVAGWFESPPPPYEATPSIGDQERDWLAKISAATGVVDPDWNPAPDWFVYALAASDSSVYVGGEFHHVGGVHSQRLAKLDADGTGAADPSWTPNVALGGSDWVDTLELAGPDLYVGGAFWAIGGLPRSNLAKLDSGGTGAVDPTWDPSPDGEVDDVQLSGSDLFVAGNFRTVGGQAVEHLAKLSTTGTGAADPAWKPADYLDDVNALGISGGDLVVGGRFDSGLGGANDNEFLTKLSTSGSGAATGWSPILNDRVYAIATSGSRIFAGGKFDSGGPQYRFRGGLIRLNGDGSLDDGWDPQVGPGVNALSLAGQDLIAGGDFASVHGEDQRGLVKLGTEGSGARDATWSTELGPGGLVHALARSGDSLFVGGTFSGADSIGGEDRQNLAKLSAATGVVDPAWNPGTIGAVDALALSGSDLFAGGDGLAKLSTTGAGAVDPAWDPRPDGEVRALLVSGPSVYAGGDFRTLGGEHSGSLAKLSAAGAGDRDASWAPQPDHPVRALALSGDDLYAGGEAPGQEQIYSPVARVVRLSAATGVADWTFESPFLSTGSVNAVSPHGEQLLAGGRFTNHITNQQVNLVTFAPPSRTGPPATSTDEPRPLPDSTPPTNPVFTPGPLTQPLVMSGLAIKRPKFAAGRGTRVSYRLSRAARVTFTITRALHRVGRFTLRGQKGTNRFTFRGRVNGKMLRPGRYLVTARAKAGRLSSRTLARQFRVLRR